jgi:hypothetical protein
MRVATVLALLVAAYAASTVSAQQVSACCVCTCTGAGAAPMRWQPGIDFGGKNGSMRVESCKTVCGTHCAPNGVQNYTTENQSCTPPPPIAAAPLEPSVRWSIEHAGKNPWKGNTDEFLDAPSLRQLYLAAQSGSGFEAIKQASDAELIETTRLAVAHCADDYRDRMTRKPGGWFDWAWVNKNEAWNMYSAVHKDNNIAGVRDRFQHAQRHDDAVRNTLYCFKSSEVQSLVDRYPVPPAPKVQFIKPDPPGARGRST